MNSNSDEMWGKDHTHFSETGSFSLILSQIIKLLGKHFSYSAVIFVV